MILRDNIMTECAEGRAEEKKDIARNLKSLGLATEQIQTATGLTAEEIEGL